MIIKFEFSSECEINVLCFSPFERYVEFKAYLLIGDEKVEFTENMYQMIYDEVYDKQYEIWQENVYENQVESYLLGRIL